MEASTKSIFKNYKPCVKVDKFSLSLNKTLAPTFQKVSHDQRDFS